MINPKGTESIFVLLLLCSVHTVSIVAATCKESWLEYQNRLNFEGRQRLESVWERLVLPTDKRAAEQINLLQCAIFYDAVVLFENENKELCLNPKQQQNLKKAVSTRCSIEQGLKDTNVFAVIKALKAGESANTTIRTNAVNTTYRHSVLYQAILYNKLDIAKILMMYGANPNISGYYCAFYDYPILHMAISIHSSDAIKLILSNPKFSDIKKTDSIYLNQTALNFAISRKEKNIIDLLRVYGAEENS